MGNRRHFGILNAYDARNRGDRAIVEAQLGWIQRVFPGSKVTIFSKHHEYNRNVFRGAISREPLLRIPSRGNSIGRLVTLAIDFVKYRLMGISDKRAIEFHSCDAFVICGGGYLYSSRSRLASRQLFLHVANVLAAMRTGKPVLSFPMSWGPLRKTFDRVICRHLAACMPVLVTRGSSSNELIESWGFADRVVSLPDVVTAAGELIPGVREWRRVVPQAGSLGISPINWSFERNVGINEMDNYICKLVSISREWCRTGGNCINIFPQVEVAELDDDRVVSRQLASRLREAGISCRLVESMDWELYWKEIAAQEVFIGCRMHSCIFAMVCGVPTIGLGYQPKFQELFEQLGWPDRCYSIDSFSPSDIARQLIALANHCDRMEIQKHVDELGKAVIVGMDKAWLCTVESCVKRGPWVDRKKNLISIVTPSFKQVEYLQCCAASVQDQSGYFELEHLIHDGGSGTDFDQWAAVQRGATCVSEQDDGMYDAINRGFREAKGDIIAWLNCDEQYLPGTLELVAGYFDTHPEVDVLFGDVILVNELMSPLAYRRAVVPTLEHLRYSHLSTFSAATFVRRRVVDEGHYLRTRWKTIADAVWIDELLSAGYRMAVLPKPLALFCMLGTNLGQSELLFKERKEWELELGMTDRWLRQWYVLEHRLHRLWNGAYWIRKVAVCAYVPGRQIRVDKARWTSGQWNYARSMASRIRLESEGAIDGMVNRVRQSHWALMHAMGLIAGVVYLDERVLDDVVKGPAILLMSFIYLSFGTKLRDLIVIFVLYFLTSAYVLRVRPVDVEVVRLLTFVAGSVMAVLFSVTLQRLKDWNHSTAALLRGIPSPILLVNRFGKVILVNRAACTLLHSDEQQLLKQEVMLVDQAGDGLFRKQSTIRDGLGHHPDGVFRLKLTNGDKSLVANAHVFFVGKDNYRVYAFTLEPTEVR